jgi:flagellar protein FlgJ
MSISIGTDSMFQLPVSNMETSSATRKLESTLKDNNLEKMPDAELMEACKSFETYFVEQVVKAMRKTVPNNEEENDYMNYFGDMLYQKYSENITESGELGIAQMLYESMKRN